MANWIQFARDAAVIGINNPKMAVKIKERRDELFAATLTDGGLDKLASSSKNGISMAVMTGNNQSMSKTEELAALQRAVEWIEAGAVPSQTRSLTRFWC